METIFKSDDKISDILTDKKNMNETDMNNLQRENTDKYKRDIRKQALVTFGIALFFHSLIDGLSVGVFTDVGQMGVLAASIIIHKIPVAFTLGFTFEQSG